MRRWAALVVGVVLETGAAAFDELGPPPAAAPGTREGLRVSTASVSSADPFWIEAARRVNLPAARLEGLSDRGFGRTEILVLCDIVRRSTQSLDALAAAREKGQSLRALASGASVDYLPLFRSASRLHREIDDQLKSGPPEAKAP